MCNVLSTHRRGFSLLEILVVVVILIILIAIIVPLTGSGSTEKQTRVTLAVLRERMHEYLQDKAEPTAAKWFDALKGEKNGANQLVHLPQANGQIVDAFGTPITYVPAHTPPGNNPAGYFQSAGRDKTFGTADDLMSGPVAP